MSIAVMSAIWARSPAEGSDLLLLLALADHANDQGICWPSLDTLSQKLRRDERTVRRVLRRCERRGWVAATARPGTSSLYHVLTPDIHVPPDTGVPPDKNVPPPRTQLCPPTPDTAMSPESSLNPQGTVSRAVRARRTARTLPDHFGLSDTGAAYAATVGVRDPGDEFARFRDHHAAKGTKMVDWDAAWRNWCRRAREFAGRAGRIESGAAVDPTPPWLRKGMA